jgi:hypothetical protein
MTPRLYMLSELRTVLEAVIEAVKTISLLVCFGLLLVLTIVMVCVGAVTLKRWLGKARIRGVLTGADRTATRDSFAPWRSPGSFAELNNQLIVSQTAIPSVHTRRR